MHESYNSYNGWVNPTSIFEQYNPYYSIPSRYSAHVQNIPAFLSYKWSQNNIPVWNNHNYAIGYVCGYKSFYHQKQFS